MIAHRNHICTHAAQERINDSRRGGFVVGRIWRVMGARGRAPSSAIICTSLQTDNEDSTPSISLLRALPDANWSRYDGHKAVKAQAYNGVWGKKAPSGVLGQSTLDRASKG